MRSSTPTSVDPETGKVMGSTFLARWGAGLLTGIVGGVGGVLGGLLVAGLFWGIVLGVYLGGLRLLGASAAGMFHGLACMGVLGLLGGGIVGGTAALDYLHGAGVSQRVHDSIVHWQHARRQSLQEGARIPQGALSRVRPPQQPQPTEASLSLAEGLMEPPVGLQAGGKELQGEIVPVRSGDDGADPGREEGDNVDRVIQANREERMGQIVGE